MAEELPRRREPEPEPIYEQDWVECVPPGPREPQEERVVLWEWHEQHPNGEAFLVPGPARFVAITPQVAYQLQMGKLRRAAEPAETLEEHLHKTGTKQDAPGEYHHIAMAPAREAKAMRPRPKPTGRRDR